MRRESRFRLDNVDLDGVQPKGDAGYWRQKEAIEDYDRGRSIEKTRERKTQAKRCDET
jgi:hypothetical protein